MLIAFSAGEPAAPLWPSRVSRASGINNAPMHKLPCPGRSANAPEKSHHVAPANNAIVSPKEWTSSVLEALRDDAAALGELRHDLFVQPNVHLGRAVEAAFIAEFLCELLASGQT
jgi:hypothetical protein